MTTISSTGPSIWKNPAFSVLFSTALFAAFSSKIYDLALPLLVFDLTRSAQWMGWMRAVEFLPNLLLALFIGVWVDKSNKKRWSQWMLIGQFTTLVTAYLAVEYLAKPLAVLFPCAFLMMAFNYGYQNARMSILKHALPQHMQNLATARISSLYSIMETIGPVLSGAILMLSAIHHVFIWCAALLLLSFWRLHSLPYQESSATLSNKKLPVLKQIAQGWHLWYQEKNMRLITFAVMVINTTGAVFWIQAIYFAKAELALDSLQVSYLVAASGIGGLLGAFSAEKVRAQIGLGRLLIGAIILESFGFLFPALSSNLIALAASLFWISSIGLYSNICIWSYRQEAFESQHIGKVAGITGSLFKLLMPFGLAASGYLVSGFGLTSVFIACYAIQLLTGVILCFTRVVRIA